MKTRMLSVFLTVCMLFVMLPIAVSAEAGDTADITVNVIIRGDEVHEEGAHTVYSEWLNTAVTVPAGTDAQTAVTEAADGYTLTGIESNYLYSVTNPDGVTLTAGESNSVLSGWMYDVNSESPTVAMSDYILADGDTVNFFWVDDFNEVFGPAVPEMAFTDVSENDWFYADVTELYEAGVFCDAMTTEIHPYARLDQGVLLTYLWRAAGLSAEAEKAIWSFDAIRWASENGICAANVDPEVLMTRGGIVRYLYLYKNAAPDAVIETAEPASDAIVDTFADGGQVDAAERAAFAWAIENGIVNGAVGADGTVLLNPDGAASHAEAIALIARLIK